MRAANELKSPNRIVAIICSILFIASFIACNPGFLSSDSLDQYNQSVTGKYMDWHPPLMAFVWRMLNNIYQGPQVMLVMQLVFLWLSIYLIATTFKNKYWYVFAGMFALAPFVLNFAGNIFKDSQMALSWLLAFSFLFKAAVNETKPKIWQLLGCALLIFYGAWIRYNALPACLPLLFLLSYVWVNGKRKLIGTFLVLSLFALAGTFAFTGRIFNAIKSFPESKLYMHDLSGIFVKTGENVFPAILYTKPGIDTTYLRAKYTTATFDNIWWNADNKPFAPEPVPEMISELREAWLKAIKRHPGVYISNRYDGFLSFLRLRKRTGGFVYASPGIEQNGYGYEPMGRGFHQALTMSFELHDNMPYMRPWFWFFVNVLLILFLPLVRNSILKICCGLLAFSSLLYLLLQFFVYQIDTEFRYVYWNCISCALAVGILCMAARSNKKEKAA
jgi:hypothetical protein